MYSVYEIICLDSGSTPLTSTRHEEKRPLLENAKTCYGQTYELVGGPHNYTGVFGFDRQRR